MSSNVFLTIANGVRTLVTAISSSSGASDANKILMTNSSGDLDSSFLPPGVGPDTVIRVATEDLAAGSYVNFWDDAGTASVRLADKTNARPANGFVLAAVTTGQNATVYRIGTNDQLSSRTPGARQYLGNNGTASESPPDPATDSGQILQYLGTADGATTAAFNDNGYIIFG